ncbi:hypothetical protein ACOME3_009181 [Neoechinorhynchus agilis]
MQSTNRLQKVPRPTDHVPPNGRKVLTNTRTVNNSSSKAAAAATASSGSSVGCNNDVVRNKGNQVLHTTNARNLSTIHAETASSRSRKDALGHLQKPVMSSSRAMTGTSSRMKCESHATTGKTAPKSSKFPIPRGTSNLTAKNPHVKESIEKQELKPKRFVHSSNLSSAKDVHANKKATERPPFTAQPKRAIVQASGSRPVNVKHSNKTEKKESVVDPLRKPLTIRKKNITEKAKASVPVERHVEPEVNIASKKPVASQNAVESSKEACYDLVKTLVEPRKDHGEVPENTGDVQQIVSYDEQLNSNVLDPQPVMEEDINSSYESQVPKAMLVDSSFSSSTVISDTNSNIPEAMLLDTSPSEIGEIIVSEEVNEIKEFDGAKLPTISEGIDQQSFGVLREEEDNVCPSYVPSRSNASPSTTADVSPNGLINMAEHLEDEKLIDSDENALKKESQMSSCDVDKLSNELLCGSVQSKVELSMPIDKQKVNDGISERALVALEDETDEARQGYNNAALVERLKKGLNCEITSWMKSLLTNDKPLSGETTKSNLDNASVECSNKEAQCIDEEPKSAGYNLVESSVDVKNEIVFQAVEPDELTSALDVTLNDSSSSKSIEEIDEKSICDQKEESTIDNANIDDISSIDGTMKHLYGFQTKMICEDLREKSMLQHTRISDTTHSEDSKDEQTTMEAKSIQDHERLPAVIKESSFDDSRCQESQLKSTEIKFCSADSDEKRSTNEHSPDTDTSLAAADQICEALESIQEHSSSEFALMSECQYYKDAENENSRSDMHGILSGLSDDFACLISSRSGSTLVQSSTVDPVLHQRTMGHTSSDGALVMNTFNPVDSLPPPFTSEDRSLSTSIIEKKSGVFMVDTVETMSPDEVNAIDSMLVTQAIVDSNSGEAAGSDDRSLNVAPSVSAEEEEDENHISEHSSHPGMSTVFKQWNLEQKKK